MRPAVDPGAAAHVLVLIGQNDTIIDLRRQWEDEEVVGPDSAQAPRTDSASVAGGGASP